MTEAPLNLRVGVLLAVPLLATVVGVIFLPRPVNVQESRKSVDRSALREVVRTAKPTPRDPFELILGDDIKIIGASLPAEPVSPGDTIVISTFIEVLHELDRNWKMFCHIDLRGGRHRVHGDHYPLSGQYPTSAWQKGEFVEDRFEKTVDRGAPAGTYDVFVGFYIGDERMPFTSGDNKHHSGDNRVRLGSITIQ